MGKAGHGARRSLRRLFAPALGRYHSARAQLDGIDQRSRVINDQVSVVLQRLVDLEGNLRVDANVLGEFSRASRRIVTELEDRLDDLADVAGAPGRTSDAPDARLLEVAAIATALAALDAAPPALVAGADAGDIALTMAAMGYATTLVGDGAPAGHPLLTVVDAALDEWPGPDVPAAAAVVRCGFDVEAPLLDRVGQWLEPGGRLVLAVRHQHAPDEPAPDLDDQHLSKALIDWEITNEQVYVQTVGTVTWTMVEGGRGDIDWASVRSALVLVTAARP